MVFFDYFIKQSVSEEEAEKIEQILITDKEILPNILIHEDGGSNNSPDKMTWCHVQQAFIKLGYITTETDFNKMILSIPGIYDATNYKKRDKQDTRSIYAALYRGAKKSKWTDKDNEHINNLTKKFEHDALTAYELADNPKIPVIRHNEPKKQEDSAGLKEMTENIRMDTANHKEVNILEERENIVVKCKVGEYIFVDMGLPSHTLWAVDNIGHGRNYYAWGESSPKSVYSIDEYKFAQRLGYDEEALFDEPKLNRYVNSNSSEDGYVVDNLWMLKEEDDAVARICNSALCAIPTAWQWEELLKIEHYYDHTGDIYKIQYGNNTISFPCGCKRSSNEVQGSCFYWSKSLSPSNSKKAIICDISSVPQTRMRAFPRFYGLPIRPVCNINMDRESLVEKEKEYFRGHNEL